MEPIKNNDHFIYFETGLAPLIALLTEKNYSKIFVFADSNTAKLCIPVFESLLPDFPSFDIIETEPGEANKTINFCIDIWKTLLDFEADRKCLVINLGGGVITDMGGFIASTYKRGIDFINIPTTLLSQVDASVGGKTGIDIDNVKNMVGTFSLPQAVFIENVFLQTLSKREMLSGFAEMIKHGLIADKVYYEQLKQVDYAEIDAKAIYHSVQIKNKVVLADPLEKGLRKILNFGHTIGHAVEGYALTNDDTPLTHGEAIAIGMICESFLSAKYCNLSQEDLDEISKYILSIYPKYNIESKSFADLHTLMQSDKKNEDGFIMFSLLDEIGKCTFNCKVTKADIERSLRYYNNL